MKNFIKYSLLFNILFSTYASSTENNETLSIHDIDGKTVVISISEVFDELLKRKTDDFKFEAEIVRDVPGVIIFKKPTLVLNNIKKNIVIEGVTPTTNIGKLHNICRALFPQFERLYKSNGVISLIHEVVLNNNAKKGDIVISKLNYSFIKELSENDELNSFSLIEEIICERK